MGRLWPRDLELPGRAACKNLRSWQCISPQALCLPLIPENSYARLARERSGLPKIVRRHQCLGRGCFAGTGRSCPRCPFARERRKMDNLTKREQPDRSKINMSEDFEVKYWSKALGVSKADLQRAVDKVGNAAAAVRKELGFRNA